MSDHDKLSGLDVHVPHTFTYADQTARLAAVSSDFTDPDDLLKIARQVSDVTYWVLESIDPSVVWTPFGGGAGGGAVSAPVNSIQFNEAGAFGGDLELTWDTINKVMQLLGDFVQAGGDPTTLYTPTQVSATPTGANPRFSVVQANYLYVCDATDNDLRIFDVTDPAAPALIHTLAMGGGGRGIDVAGRYLYYTDEDNGGRLIIVDVEKKTAPVIVGTLVTGGSPRGVRVQGTIAIVSYAAAANGLRFFDVSDPTTPFLLDSVNLGSAARTDFDIQGTVVAVPSSGQTQLWDFSDPTNVTFLTSINGESDSCKFQGRYLYRADEGAEELQIHDVSDPTTPALVGQLALVAPSSVRAISVSGNFLYFVDASNDELRVVDVSDPTAPAFISSPVSAGLNPIALTTVGRYGYVLDNNGDQFLIMDLRGIDAQNLNVGNIDAGNMNLRRDLRMGGIFSAGGGTLGFGGLNSDGPIAAEGRLLGGASRNVVEVFDQDDFPDVGGFIKPDPGVTYVVMQPITLTKKITHPATVTGFDPAVIRTDAKHANIVTVNVPAGALLETTAGAGQLILQNIIFVSDGVAAFADVSGATQTGVLTELDDAQLDGFADGTVFDTCLFNPNNNTFWTGSGVFTLIDVEMNAVGMFTANFSDSGQPTFDIRSASGSSTPSLITIRDTKLSSQANEAFVMLHSNLIAGSTIQAINVQFSPFTPGTGDFYDVQTVSITGLVDSGAAPGVRTVVQATGHNVADGDTVVHTGFTTETQLNGTFVASDVVAGVSYEVVAVFGGTDTGVSSNSSLDQQAAIVLARDNPGHPDSKVLGFAFAKQNAAITVIAAADTFTDLNLGGNALAGSNNERWSLTDNITGELTYDGVEPFAGFVFVHVSLLADLGSPTYAVRAVKNGAVMVDAIEFTIAAPDASTVVSVGFLVPVSVVSGDTVRLQVENRDNANDVTVVDFNVAIQ